MVSFWSVEFGTTPGDEPGLQASKSHHACSTCGEGQNIVEKPSDVLQTGPLRLFDSLTVLLTCRSLINCPLRLGAYPFGLQWPTHRYPLDDRAVAADQGGKALALMRQSRPGSATSGRDEERGAAGQDPRTF